MARKGVVEREMIRPLHLLIDCVEPHCFCVTDSVEVAPQANFLTPSDFDVDHVDDTEMIRMLASVEFVD